MQTSYNSAKLAENRYYMNIFLHIEKVFVILRANEVKTMENLREYNPEGSTLRKAQMRMLTMLIEVDKICRKHNIPYWMDFGTLLGAVRHKGFIPWDDDIDICVLKKDYPRLREVLIKELPPQFVFQDSKTDKYAFFDYGRVRDKKSYCYYPYFTKLKEQGLWMDIFTYAPIASPKLKNIVDFFYRRTYHEIHHYGDVAYTSKFRIICNRVIAYLLHPCSLFAKWVVEWLGKHCNHKRLYSRWTVSKDVFCEENIFPLTELEFEGHMFYAPGNWHDHLTGIYKDYKQIPPKEKREQILNMDLVKFYQD